MASIRSLFLMPVEEQSCNCECSPAAKDVAAHEFKVVKHPCSLSDERLCVIKWTLETRKLSELKAYEKNPRCITEKGLDDLIKKP